MSNVMKVSLSFDDGRIDTFENAYRIMKKYDLNGTIHVVSGYIDGTYTNHLASSHNPCTIEQLQEMKANGFEISLHGDQHKTEMNDLSLCIKKMKEWKLLDKHFGFSVPYSNENALFNPEFQDYLKNSELQYVRVGKNMDKTGIMAKLKYILYRLTNSSLFYCWYNKLNINNIEKYNKMRINSVTVRREDSVKMITDLINKNNSKDAWLVLMLHGILPKEDELYSESEWAWDINKFTQLCEQLNVMQKQGKVQVETIINVVGENNV